MQFDKELSERDKIITLIKKETLGELQKVGGQLMGELEIQRRVLAEKSDRRDVAELKMAVSNGLEKKPDMSEIH